MFISSHRRILGNRTFVLLWASDVVSALGDRFFDLAALWLIYTQTHSTLATASLLVVEILAQTLFAPLSVFADRPHRGQILFIAYVALGAIVGLCSAGIAAFARPGVHVDILYGTVIAFNALYAISGPARFALTPQLLDPELLMSANGMMSITSSVNTIVANGLAGEAVAALGAVFAFLVDMASFFWQPYC
ncbi:MAG: MFS transporter [Firmicutes bacterium]|nr:MFS transporter [Bacillota bacterium]